MSVRDPRPTRVRGVGRDAAGVVLSIDVDGVHGEAGPPLKVVMTADEAWLTGHLLMEAAKLRGAVPAATSRGVAPLVEDEIDLAEEPHVLAAERWGRRLGRHVRGLLGFRSPGGAADPRAPP